MIELTLHKLMEIIMKSARWLFDKIIKKNER